MADPVDLENFESVDLGRKVSNLTYQVNLSMKDRIDLPDEAAYRAAVEHRGHLRAMKDEVARVMQPLIDGATKHLNMLRDTRKSMEEPLSKAVILIDSALASYERDAKSRAILAQHAEEMKEVKKRDEIVQDLRAKGMIKEAKEVLVAPLPEVPAAGGNLVPNVSGFSKRTNWSAQVTDFPALVKAVAEGKAPMECLLPNDTVLNSLARAAKSSLDLPGVKSTSTQSRTQRR